jgi:hypothetical protein
MARRRGCDGDCSAGGLRRDGGLVLCGGAIPRQQLADALGRVGGEASDDVAQPSLGVDAIELGGLGQRVEGRGAFADAVRTGEEPFAPFP